VLISEKIDLAINIPQKQKHVEKRIEKIIFIIKGLN
jgi:hypothetical protein